MRQCPNCKTNNPDDARFCNYCGMRLPESKEETLYSDLDELEEAPKTEFSDQEIEEESEKVIDEAKKLLNPDEKEEKEVFLQEEKKEERKEDEDTDTEQKQWCGLLPQNRSNNGYLLFYKKFSRNIDFYGR